MDYKKYFKAYDLNEEIKFKYNFDDFFDFLIKKKNDTMDNTTKLISCYLLSIFLKVTLLGEEDDCAKSLANTKKLLETDSEVLEEFVFAIYQMYGAAQIKYAIDEYKYEHKHEFQDIDKNGKDASCFYFDEFDKEEVEEFIEHYHDKKYAKNYGISSSLIINFELLQETLKLIKAAYPDFYNSWDVLEILLKQEKLNEECKEAIWCLNWVLYMLSNNVQDESMYHEVNSNEEEISNLYLDKYMDTLRWCVIARSALLGPNVNGIEQTILIFFMELSANGGYKKVAEGVATYLFKYSDSKESMYSLMMNAITLFIHYDEIGMKLDFKWHQFNWSMLDDFPLARKEWWCNPKKVHTRLNKLIEKKYNSVIDDFKNFVKKSNKQENKSEDIKNLTKESNKQKDKKTKDLHDQQLDRVVINDDPEDFTDSLTNNNKLNQVSQESLIFWVYSLYELYRSLDIERDRWDAIMNGSFKNEEAKGYYWLLENYLTCRTKAFASLKHAAFKAGDAEWLENKDKSWLETVKNNPKILFRTLNRKSMIDALNFIKDKYPSYYNIHKSSYNHFIETFEVQDDIVEIFFYTLNANENINILAKDYKKMMLEHKNLAAQSNFYMISTIELEFYNALDEIILDGTFKGKKLEGDLFMDEMNAYVSDNVGSNKWDAKFNNFINGNITGDEKLKHSLLNHMVSNELERHTEYVYKKKTN